jgi:hypothetical protein
MHFLCIWAENSYQDYAITKAGLDKGIEFRRIGERGVQN